MVNFDFVFIVKIYPSILAILNYLPTLDGKFCFCLQCHDLPLNMGKKFSLEISWNFDSTHAVLTVKALPDYSGKLLLWYIKIKIYHPFLALPISDGKLLPKNQIHNLPLDMGSSLTIFNGKSCIWSQGSNLPSETGSDQKEW